MGGQEAGDKRGGASYPKNIASLPGREQELGTDPKPIHRGRQSGRNETPEKSYAGKVDVIYIDPPYNTGKDFIFNDTFALSQEESDEKQGRYNEEGQRLFQNTEANGKFHSDWCSMMYARLMLARTLLNDNGIIFISIDDHELANLIKIGNEVFNASNFIDVFNWAKTETPENLSKKVSKSSNTSSAIRRRKTT